MITLKSLMLFDIFQIDKLVFLVPMADDNKLKFFSNLDLSKPRWSQDTYIGRAKHFFTGIHKFGVKCI